MLNKLREKIITEAQVFGEIVKIDHFLNHQIDTQLLDEVGVDIAKEFPNATKILTIETSGIAFASSVARTLDYLPLVFAKKVESSITTGEYYLSKTYSFTKKREYSVRVDKRFISENDKVLIVDDFLANGEAASSLIDIVNQAGAEVVGIGIVVEKGFQKGRKVLEEKGHKVYSCSIIERVENGQVYMK
ncbi:xanthine phosphoribosyltransferase [Mycoplasmatota bacterium]|nr:xanthine phosphoribosyltransferase [Mycoplasmatota bacterium]